jgi:hypothetical protein
MSDLEKAIDHLAKAAELLGWQIVFPNGNDEENVDYVLLVNPDKADEIVEKLEK